MADTISRRDMLRVSFRTATAVAASTMASELVPTGASARSTPTPSDRKDEQTGRIVTLGSGVQLHYREDWLGAPWLKPEPALLIHGNLETSDAWFGWVPRMAQEFRVLRPDLPGCGYSTVPHDFEWSLESMATSVADFLDKIGVDSAHIIGARLGGIIAIEVAVHFPQRVRTLVVASTPITHKPPDPKTGMGDSVPGRKILGSAASKEQVEYWDKMLAAESRETRMGIAKAISDINIENILPRIAAPTLVIANEGSAIQPVETVLHYQQKIPNSRLLVLSSDADDVALARTDECVTSVLSFIKETKQRS
jgi:3-oxoadipate enol-lactonase